MKTSPKLGKWDPFRPKWPTTGEGSAFPPALGEASRHVSPISLIIMVAAFLALLVTCVCTRGRGPRASRRRAAMKDMLPPSRHPRRLLQRQAQQPWRLRLANMEEAAGDVSKGGFWSKIGKRADTKNYSPTMEAEFGFTSKAARKRAAVARVDPQVEARGHLRHANEAARVSLASWAGQHVVWLGVDVYFPFAFIATQVSIQETPFESTHRS